MNGRQLFDDAQREIEDHEERLMTEYAMPPLDTSDNAFKSFFLHGSPSEQRLVQDLVNEHLKMFGQDVLYLPRKIINELTVIKEINASRFEIVSESNISNQL